MEIKKVQLIEILGSEIAMGSASAREVKKKLKSLVGKFDCSDVFELSLAHIQVMDSVFARDCIFSIAKFYRTRKWFYLTQLPEDRISFNLQCASRVEDQPVICIAQGKKQYISSSLDKRALGILNLLDHHESINSVKVAEHFDVSIQNASGRLKSLYDQGLVRRHQIQSVTGGLEYAYQSAIKHIN